MSVKKLRIVPLGGLGEIGKNMMAIEYGEAILVIDPGLMFPDNDMLGIDYIIPDFGYLLDKRERICGIIITHGHEDHTGAVHHVLEELKAPIYATRCAVAGRVPRHGRSAGSGSRRRHGNGDAGDCGRGSLVRQAIGRRRGVYRTDLRGGLVRGGGGIEGRTEPYRRIDVARGTAIGAPVSAGEDGRFRAAVDPAVRAHDGVAPGARLEVYTILSNGHRVGRVFAGPRLSLSLDRGTVDVSGDPRLAVAVTAPSGGSGAVRAQIPATQLGRQDYDIS